MYSWIVSKRAANLIETETRKAFLWKAGVRSPISTLFIGIVFTGRPVVLDKINSGVSTV